MTDNPGMAWTDNDPRFPGQKVFTSWYAVNHPHDVMDANKGKFVAWSMDGRTLLAAADTQEELFDLILKLKLDSNEHIADYIPIDPWLD